MKNKNFKFKRGSEWRKWDLHVHTPGTKLNDGYKISNGQNELDTFCEKIENSDVFVFGITDYFSVDTYFNFIERFNKKYPNSKKVFFPNIEFRTESKNSKNEHIQIHVIFSNNQDTLDKINNFLARLELISKDNEKLTNKYCISKDLKDIGYDKAMINTETLIDKLKGDFTDNEYLIVGVANGYGSLRPGKHDGRGGEYAKELDRKCHLFFGKAENRDFFLNKQEGRDKYILPPKPVVFGCDAHSFDDLEKKLGKLFEEKNSYSEITWIKADPTFEGLKQIVYEPEDRVIIQETKPEEKEDYHIIDKVKFEDDSFINDEILIKPSASF